MKNPQSRKWKSATSLALGAFLIATSPVLAQLTITGSSQLGALPLTPAWTAATNSLIGNLVPTVQIGNFGAFNTGGTASNLTVNGISLTVKKNLGAGNDGLEICGSGGGSMLVYTLPPSANGFDITNITTYGGWQDGGRDREDYTVSYATAADPNNFLYLATVRYDPSDPSATGSAVRVAIADAAGAPIAKSVVAVMFDFLAPPAENSAAGYTAITVQGTAAASLTVPTVSISATNQTSSSAFTPNWVVETDSLINGLAPSTALGNFLNSGTGGTAVLTDGSVGDVTGFGGFASCGGSSGTSLIYTLTNSVNGSDLTNIVVYTGWQDNGRFGQYYTLSYSTVTAPTTFVPITTVFYLPVIPGGTKVAARVAISPLATPQLAKNVASLKFDFGGPTLASSFNNGWQGYSEIIVEGTNSLPPTLPPSTYLVQDTLPNYAETVVGDQVIFNAVFSNAPPASFQWQFISGATTNNLPGATNVTVTTDGNNNLQATLTLNNVQVTNSGLYVLKAVNATNGTALPSYTTARQLVVGATPTPINNVIVNYAGQMFPSSTNFFPVWPVVTTNSLVYGFIPGSGPGTFTQAGDFSANSVCNFDATIMSDGFAGSFTSVPTLIAVAGGPTIASVGSSITYTLNPASVGLGFDLTNITMFGGWQDEGRNEQKYQILYATISAPTTFVALLTADYAPATIAGNLPTVTRTSLVPATGVLAHNVVAVKLSFDVSPAPKNSWEGYTEFIVQGTPSLGTAPNLVQDITPNTASDVIGGQFVISAGFSNYTTLQWTKNGANVPGATLPTLTLNNVTTNDAGTYVLVASNPFGSTSSGGCGIAVNATPVPVGNVLTAIATQTSDAQVFTPTWSTNALAASLIAGTAPFTTGPGDFTGGTFGTTPTGASDPTILTDGSFGTVDFSVTATHLNWTCLGSGTGPGNTFGAHSVTYALPNAPNGYTITNIVTAGGWNDAGRDQQAYTVAYSTAENPDDFLPIAIVNYNPVNPVGYSLTRATLTPVSGALASNAAFLKFDMTYPAGENGFSGYSEFAVYGAPSANPLPTTAPVITFQNELGTFDFVPETPNLIANRLPSSTGPGVFTEGGCNVTNLTDGVLGFGAAFSASCGDDGVAVPYLVFNSTSGWNLSNIVVYTLWPDSGRDGQFYNLSYSTLSAPATFLPLASVNYNPDIQTLTPSANRVQIAPAPGQSMLATNVYAVKFDFTPQGGQDNGWSGYSEIVLQGSSLTPPSAPVVNPVTLSGGNLILTGSGAANYSYTVLTTTNLLTPTANWTVYTNAATSATGGISNAIPVNAGQPARFFRLQMP